MQSSEEEQSFLMKDNIERTQKTYFIKNKQVIKKFTQKDNNNNNKMLSHVKSNVINLIVIVFIILVAGLLIYQIQQQDFIYLKKHSIHINLGMLQLKKTQEKQHVPSEVIKPINDQNKYKLLKLKNNLKVLLISDRAAKINVAAMDVYAGQWNGPAEWPGLPHFLEHMLFISNKKYTEINYFQKFLAQNGGMTNAYTAFVNTNYYFKSSPNSFKTALNIFGHFFIDPVFLQEATEKESSAVNGEYEMRIQADDRKALHLLTQICNKTHPLSNYFIGSTKSLRKDGVIEALKLYHEQFYSSNLMSLTIYGSQDLNELEAMIKDGEFDNIVDKNVTKPDFSLNGKPFDEAIGHIYKLQTIQKTKVLMLLFQVDNTLKHFQTKPVNFLIYQINYCGQNSFKLHLQEANLIKDMSAYIYIESDVFTIVGVSIDLTDQGLTKTGYIINAFHNYLKKIKNEGITEELYKQVQKIQGLQFKFLELSGISEKTVSQYSKILNLLSDDQQQHILDYDNFFQQFDSELIHSFVDQLLDFNNFFAIISANYKDLYSKDNNNNTQNCSFIQTDNNTESDVIFGSELNNLIENDKFDFYNETLNIQWSLSNKLDQQTILKLQQENQDILKNVDLVKINHFIPEQTDIISLCSNNTNQDNASSSIQQTVQIQLSNNSESTIQEKDPYSDQERYKQFAYQPFIYDDKNNESNCLNQELEYEQIHKYPQLLKEDQSGQVWFALDRSFKVPKSGIQSIIMSPVPLSSPLNYTAFILYKFIVQEQIKKVLADAIDADYQINLVNLNNVFQIYLYGWSSKIEQVLTKVMETIKTLNIDNSSYDLAFQKLKQAIERSDGFNPFIQGQQIWLKKIMLEPAFTPSDILTVLNQVKYEDVKSLQVDLFKQYKIDTIAYGNIDSQQTLQYVDKIIQTFGQSHEVDKSLFNFNVRNVSQQSFLFREWVLGDAVGKNSATVNYYQIGKRSLTSYISVGLLKQVLNNGIFQYCRTERELGYIASASPVSFGSVDGFLIFVEGSKQWPYEVDSIIEQALDRFKEKVHNFTNEDLANLRISFISNLQQEFNNLEDKYSYFWNQVIQGTYVFDQRELAQSQLDKIDKESLEQFISKVFGDQRGKLGINLYSKTYDKDPNTLDLQNDKFNKTPVLLKNLTNISEFNNASYVTPFYSPLL